LITWIGNTVFILYTECNYRDSLMERMPSLIAILIVYMSYAMKSFYYCVIELRVCIICLLKRWTKWLKDRHKNMEPFYYGVE
jgi:hypothetical protein